MRGRALAIRTGNVDCSQLVMWIAQMLHESQRIIQAGLIGRSTDLMKSGLRSIEILKSLLIRGGHENR